MSAAYQPMMCMCVRSACAAAASMWLHGRGTAHGQPYPSRALLPACCCHLPSICFPGCSILYRHVDNPHRLYANYQVGGGHCSHCVLLTALDTRLCSRGKRDCPVAVASLALMWLAVSSLSRRTLLVCCSSARLLTEHLSLSAARRPQVPWAQYWQRGFWGANYDRLQRIKAAVDPLGLFDKPLTVQGAALEWDTAQSQRRRGRRL